MSGESVDTANADGIPTREQLADWLAKQGHLRVWADSLAGLPWKYVMPVVEIAATTKVHPLLALGASALYSKDPEFRAAAIRHTTPPA